VTSFFFFSSRRRHTRSKRDWSSDVCSSDLFTVARLGGDEFTVLLDDIKDPNDAKRAADRMMKSLSAPFILGGKEVFTSVSIGIEIGRASCRERVKMSVVGGSLKENDVWMSE